MDRITLFLIAIFIFEAFGIAILGIDIQKLHDKFDKYFKDKESK